MFLSLQLFYSLTFQLHLDLFKKYFFTVSFSLFSHFSEFLYKTTIQSIIHQHFSHLTDLPTYTKDMMLHMWVTSRFLCSFRYYILQLDFFSYWKTWNGKEGSIVNVKKVYLLIWKFLCLKAAIVLYTIFKSNLNILYTPWIKRCVRSLRVD
jgi:hypothetical protein